MSTIDNRPELLVPAGKLFQFTEGEYSDFGIMGTFLALEDITKTLLLETKNLIQAELLISLSDPYDHEISQGLADRFLPALVRKGVLMDVDMVSLHYSNYGRFELC